MTLSLILPWPPSVNHYWIRPRGRHGLIVGPQGRAYKEHVAWLMNLAEVSPVDYPLSLQVWLYRPNKRSDIDNQNKALLDSLTGYAWVDDRQIEQMATYKLLDRKNPRVEMILCPYQPTKVPLPPSMLYPGMMSAAIGSWSSPLV